MTRLTRRGERVAQLLVVPVIVGWCFLADWLGWVVAGGTQ